MAFTWKGVPLTPALTEIEEGDGLNTEQRRILAENFVSHPSELTNPTAKLAFAHAAPAPFVPPAEERCRPLLDPAKLDAARMGPVERLRLFEETKTVGVALAQRDLDPALRVVSDAEYRAALALVQPYLRDQTQS